MNVARGLLLDEVLQGACFARHRESTLHSDSSGAIVRDSTLYSADFQSAFRLTQLGFLALDEVLQGVLGEAQSAFRLTGGVTQRGFTYFRAMRAPSASPAWSASHCE